MPIIGRKSPVSPDIPEAPQRTHTRPQAVPRAVEACTT